MGPVIQEMRYIKSEEEMNLVERSAQLADKAFAEIIKVLKPGMTQFEVAALLEKPMREEGGEDFFDLIFSGPFGPGIGMDCFVPTDRRIQVGDSILMEITPRYEGYWAQLVRIVSIGRENKDLANYHRVARDAISAAIRYFKPGVKLGDAVHEAKRTVESAGFELRPPMGHLCGLDLIEARVKLESEEILQPGVVIIFHPPIYSGTTSIFWGETYLITAEGYRRVHQATDELIVVS
jgi:Xaa-Pro aminopeptidase